jgi:hypothetical protein
MKKFYVQCMLAFLGSVALASGVSYVTGCATLTGAVAPQVAKAVTKYCQEPYAERSLIRAQVNDMIAPATIKVTCAGDPQ